MQGVFIPFLNAGMSDRAAFGQSVAEKNKNADAGTNQVPECVDTGLRSWMPEGRCPAMNLATDLISLFELKCRHFGYLAILPPLF
jgi:hypothetical protein